MRRYQDFMYVGFSLLLFLLAALIDEGEEEEQWKWRPSYSSLDTRPFGAKALQQSLEDLFPEQSISISRKSLYEVFSEEAVQDVNYVLINQSFAPTEFDAEALLDFVAEGGTALIAAQEFEGAFADTLGLSIAEIYETNKDSTSIRLTEKQYEKEGHFHFMARTVPHYFHKYDKKEALVIAQNQANKPVLIQKKWGEGILYLSSTPLAFSNYNLLWQANNQQFIAHVFGHLPQREIYWDEYYKIGRGESKDPLRFILSRRSLRAALYLSLFTVLVLVIFEGRRKQRVIPIIKKLQNDTLDFVKTVGQMYFAHKNHSDMAQKKIQFFREYLRQHYFLKEETPSPEIIEKLATKSNTPKETVERLFNMMAVLDKKTSASAPELQELSRLMHQFKQTNSVQA